MVGKLLSLTPDQPVKPTHSFVDQQHYSGSVYQPQGWHKALKAPTHEAAPQARVKASEVMTWKEDRSISVD